MGAIVREQLKTLGKTRGPTQGSNRSLEEHSPHIILQNRRFTHLISPDGRTELLERKCTPDRDGLSCVSSPQETVRVPAQRYDHYDTYQDTTGRDLIMKHTPGVDKEQILDFIYVTRNVQFLSESTPSIEKGEVNPHEVNKLPFEPIFL